MRTLALSTFAAALALMASPAAAQTAATPTMTKPATLADMQPNRPGGLVLFTNTPWNDLGAKAPVATAEGIADGRLEVVTVATVDPVTGLSAMKHVIANTPIPDTIESRLRFGGPASKAGKKTVPSGPGYVG